MRRSWFHPVTYNAQPHYVCSVCIYRYRAIRRGKGISELRQFQGYSVDLRLKQFRKMCSFFGFSSCLEVVSFNSPKGWKLHQQMHKAALAEKTGIPSWQKPIAHSSEKEEESHSGS